MIHPRSQVYMNNLTIKFPTQRPLLNVPEYSSTM